jgi:hypothetical protein
VQGQITRLREAESALMSHIRDLIDGRVGTILANDVPVFEVSYSKRIDAGRAAEILGADSDVYRSLCEAPDPTPRFSSTLAKKILPPAVYELCQKQSDVPSIKVVT